jgi:serine/threonine protein kinase
MTNSPSDVGVMPGDILAGKYRVERILGQGGMGVVVAAHHLQLDEKVALKFLLPDTGRNPDAVARFLREARAAAKIKNEHVVRVTDVGQLENGSPYIVMEYLEGSDLADWLVSHPGMPIEQVVDFVLQACEALADAHALGIIHRDLKPANLFCTQRTDGRLAIKLLDFGISKITTPGATGYDMTGSRAALGSPRYMSPEQMQGSKSVDARTDIWALGVIVFELLAGQPPFDHEMMTALALRVVNDPAPPLRAFRPDVPRELEQVVAKCLEKNRMRRFGTVGELAVALERFGPKHAHTSVERVVATLRKAALSGAPSADATNPATPIIMVPAGAPGQLSATTPLTNSSWGQATGRPQARRKVLGIGAALVVVGTVAVAGAIALRKPQDHQHDEDLAGTAAGAPAATLPLLDAALVATPSNEAAAGDLSLTASSDGAPTPSTPATSMVSTSLPRPGAVGGSKPAAITRPRATTPPPMVKNCSPPFVVDANGERKYKPECL